MQIYLIYFMKIIYFANFIGHLIHIEHKKVSIFRIPPKTSPARWNVFVGV